MGESYPASAESDRVQRLRAEFPYHWDADELVSRREFLHFAVYTSGALFAGTALLAVLGLIERLSPAPAAPEQRVARASDVPEGGALYFAYPTPDDQAVLLHLPGERFVAYNQRCTHLSCAVLPRVADGVIRCPCHEGYFDLASGRPIAGPPRRPLTTVRLEVRGDDVFAVGVEERTT
jgi:Rieske Fe-S protein